MCFFTFLNYKRREINGREFFFWNGVWILFIIISIIPEILDPIVGTFNFKRKMDLFVIASIGFLMALGFVNYLIVKKNQKRVEKIVRELALRKK